MSGNYILTIGALAILSVLILSTMDILRTNYVDMTESEIIIAGLSLGQGLLDEIKTKEFDEQEIIGSTIDSPSDLSSSLGPDAGESVSDPDTSSTQAFGSLTAFDDVDDYNGYNRLVDTDGAENFILSTVVEYVSLSDPDNTSGGSRTYCKRITVTITSPFFDSVPSVQVRTAVTY